MTPTTELSLPWRGLLARRPAAEREAWGRLANALEDQGLSWREAEEQAYWEIEARRAACTPRGRAMDDGYGRSVHRVHPSILGHPGAAGGHAGSEAQPAPPVKRAAERQGTLIGGNGR